MNTQQQNRWTPYAALIGMLVLMLAGCARDQRELQDGSQAQTTMPAPQTGVASTQQKTATPYEGNIAAINEGKLLYNQFNCVGCHAAGGGAIGPALMDDKWLYGSDPAAIFNTIVEGRPRGMPSFRDKIPEDDIWKIVAYVRSLSSPEARLPKETSIGPLQEKTSANLK